jgi:RNA-binding protein YlmH
MDPHQRAIARNVLRDSGKHVIFDGGYPSAERAIGMFLPDYMISDGINPDIIKASDDYPISLIQATYKKNQYTKNLTHRDYLGALMNLGIKRETLGDILVHEAFGQIIALSEIAPFIEQNLTQIGRAGVEVKRIETAKLAFPEAKTEEKTYTVASLRLDAIVAEGFNLSRSEASDYIESGKIYLNFEECINVSRNVDEGSTISLRGMGRVVLEKVGGNSKKNRIFITVKRFI